MNITTMFNQFDSYQRAESVRDQYPCDVPHSVAEQWRLIREDGLHEPQPKQTNRIQPRLPLNESQAITGSGGAISRTMNDATM